MHTRTDSEGPIISLERRISDLSRMSGFAAAETLRIRQRRTTIPTTTPTTASSRPAAR